MPNLDAISLNRIFFTEQFDSNPKRTKARVGFLEFYYLVKIIIKLTMETEHDNSGRIGLRVTAFSAMGENPVNVMK